MTTTLTFAQGVANISSFVNTNVIPLLFVIALVFFLIGMVRLFFSQNEENREKGRQFAIWGVVALVLLFCIWGIVSLLVATL